MNKLNLKWMTDVIGTEYKKWSEKDIVTINAQTGTGKTYFIKTKLIPFAKDNNKKVLILCNRIALKRQLKKDLFDYFNIPTPEDISLDDVKTIGNTTIMSYQAFGQALNFNKEINLDSWDYIVADESHFILSDASFNNRCSYIYNLLIKTNIDACRIFISATIEEIKPTIKENFEKMNGWLNAKLYTYCTGTDYSYLDVNLYKKNEDIANYIKLTNKKNGKWLVFVTSKKRGEDLKKELQGIKTVEFINSNTKDNVQLQNIIDNSKFDVDVLIATKVLDNGINIQDKEVKNIVLDTWDKTTFLQELGRLRVDINNPHKINLYIPMKSKKQFTAKENKYKSITNKVDVLQNDYNAFQQAQHNDYTKLDSSIFMLDENNKWCINVIGYTRFVKDYGFIKEVIEAFGEDKNYNKMAYAEIQMSWINNYNVKQIIEGVEKMNKTEMYLEEHLNKIMLTANDRKELIEVLNIRKDGHLLKRLDILNGALEEMGSNYRIKQFETTRRNADGSKKKYKNAWKIIK